MKAIVVGGGLTGCVAALELADHGFAVTLYERSANLGGVLRDHVIGDGFWFNGCQYLSPDARWLQHLRRKIDCEFDEFDLLYGSYTCAFGETIYRDDIALPVIAGRVPSFDCVPAVTETIAERFAGYGPSLADALSTMAARFGHCPADLHGNCALSMQMDRIMLSGPPVEAIGQLKRDNPIADDFLALPRQILDGSRGPWRSALPKGGYNRFFEAVETALREKRVEIATSAVVTSRPSAETPGEFDIVSRDGYITADLVVWCCNPVPILYSIGLGRLDCPVMKMLYLFGELERGGSLPHYVQCFDATSVIYRIYRFDAGTGPKICIECFDRDDLDSSVVAGEAERILVQAGYPSRIRLRDVSRKSLYVLFTPKDKEMFSEFARYARTRRLVPGAWELFSRDSKIEAITANMASLLR